MNIVLDTNVVLELLHWRDPRSLPLGTALNEGRARCFTDDACLAELERVLGYPQFALDATAQQSLYAQYRMLAINTGTPPPGESHAALPRCRDGDDQKFMELAARCGADLLVTRDKELLRLSRSRARPAPFAILVPEKAIPLLDTPPTRFQEQNG